MERKKPLHETLQSTLYNLLRSAGIPMSVKQNEALGREAQKLAEILQAEMKFHIIESLEKIQNRMVDAFKSTEERLKHLEEQKQDKGDLEKIQNRMEKRLKNIEKRLKYLEEQKQDKGE